MSHLFRAGSLRRLTLTLAVLGAALGLLAAGAGSASASAPVPRFTTPISPRNTADLLLDVSGGSTEPGAPVIDWWANGGANQAWIFQSSLYYAPNTYEIVNQNSGQCLTTDGVAGDQLYQWPCTPWSHNQVWVSDIRGFSDGQGHAISNPAFGLVVDVYGNTSWPGAAIDAWYPNGGQNQYFQSDKVAVY